MPDDTPDDVANIIETWSHFTYHNLRRLWVNAQRWYTIVEISSVYCFEKLLYAN